MIILVDFAVDCLGGGRGERLGDLTLSAMFPLSRNTRYLCIFLHKNSIVKEMAYSKLFF